MWRVVSESSSSMPQSLPSPPSLVSRFENLFLLMAYHPHDIISLSCIAAPSFSALFHSPQMFGGRDIVGGLAWFGDERKSAAGAYLVEEPKPEMAKRPYFAPPVVP